MSSNAYTMELSRPIQVDGEDVSVLTLGDPVSGALGGLDLTLGPKGLTFNVGQLIDVIAAAANIPPSSAKKIPMRDLLSHMTSILGFFGIDIPKTGGS